MALPGGGNLPPISLSDLNTEFGLGTNLNAYRGKLYAKTDGTVSRFSSSAINIADFYATAKVAAGSVTLTDKALTSYKIPPYKTIRVTVTAAGGGGAGSQGPGDGFCAGAYGFVGGAAKDSTFGASGAAWYLTSTGGGGGSNVGGSGTTYNGNAGNGANGGAGGGGTGGSGGAGAKNTTGYLTNPALSGGTGPTSASSIAMSIGAAGGAGAGGAGQQFNTYIQLCQATGFYGANGSPGGAASILIEWTGET